MPAVSRATSPARFSSSTESASASLLDQHRCGGWRIDHAELSTRNLFDAIGFGPRRLFEFETVEVLEISEGAAGVLVVVRYRGRGRTSGAPVDVPMAHVVDIRDGRVARLAWCGTRDEAAAAAGL